MTTFCKSADLGAITRMGSAASAMHRFPAASGSCARGWGRPAAIFRQASGLSAYPTWASVLGS